MRKQVIAIVLIAITILLTIATIITYDKSIFFFLLTATLDVYYFIYLLSLTLKVISGKEDLSVNEIVFKGITLTGQTVLIIVSLIVVGGVYMISSGDLMTILNPVKEIKINDDTKNRIFVINRNNLLPANLVNGENVLIKKVDNETFNLYTEKNILHPKLQEDNIIINDSRDEITYGSFKVKELNNLNLSFNIDQEIRTLSFDPGIRITNSDEDKTVTFSDDLNEVPFRLSVKWMKDSATTFDIINAHKPMKIESNITIFNRGAYPFFYSNRLFLILVIEANHDLREKKEIEFYSKFALLEIIDDEIKITANQ